MDIFQTQESNVRTYSNRFPVIFSSAKGCWLRSEKGVEYLDFLAGAGALNYGHNHPVLKEALIDYICNDGVAHGLDMHTHAKAAFLTAFRHHILAPRNLDYKVQFTGPTGTNAVEAAMKLARKVTGRNNIVAFTNGFHGCSLGSLSATGNQHHRGGAGISLGGITRIPYEGYADIDGLALFKAMLEDNSSGLDKPAAVLFETVQGEGGLNVASVSWIQKLDKLCKAHGILTIVDDIQAGCGRTGTYFSFEPSGIQPDIVTLSKSISGYGLPMALVLLKPKWDKWSPGEHNGTFRGNNHAFVTATRAIEYFWKDKRLETHIEECALFIKKEIEALREAYPVLFEKRKGRGLMQGIQCENGETAERLAALCFQKGMIIETAGPDDDVIKFFCPLTISHSELELGLGILKGAADEVAQLITRKAS